MNLAEERMKAKLESLNIKTTNKLWLSAWISLIGGWIAAGVTSAIVSKIKEIEDLAGIFVLIFFPAGVILFIFFLIQVRRTKKYNMQKLIAAKASFHQIYFESFQHLFPDGLQFDGIFPSPSPNKYCLVFSIGSEKITWGINQLFSSKDGSALEYSLVSSSKKLADFDLIAISEEREVKDLFQFESIEFTKRFKVTGANEKQIYKLLTPRIIDNFLQKEPYFLAPKTIELSQGVARIEWRGPLYAVFLTVDPLDFSKIHWTKKRMANEIFSKIEVDFARYLENQKLLEPLELYGND